MKGFYRFALLLPCTLLLALLPFPSAPVIAQPLLQPEADVICGEVVRISGQLGFDERWEAGKVYVIEGYTTVPNEGVLRIDASVVKFAPDASLDVFGRLEVVGTAAYPKYFTSLSDDSLCGDTNGDGPSSGYPGE